jgi:hypothetical protein
MAPVAASIPVTVPASWFATQSLPLPIDISRVPSPVW